MDVLGDNKNNIVLITAPRCGSTTFLQDIQDRHPRMINHHESLRTLGYGYTKEAKSDQQRKSQFKQVVRDWNDPSLSNCVKLFPIMLTEHSSPWRKPRFAFDLLQKATHCYFLLRKDFPAQVRSAVIAFYKTMHGDMNFHGSWEQPLHIPDIAETRKLIETAERQMYAQNYQVITMWNMIPEELVTKELIWLEDLDQSGKYNRPVEWEKFPNIQEYDWEIYFT